MAPAATHPRDPARRRAYTRAMERENPPFELVCYVHEGWHPRIRPARARRDWMEGTPEHYAYRCLPLAIANTHGWEMLSPCGFEAVWAGGQHADAVRITVDAADRDGDCPVSLFGAGTITFHVQGIIRTPPGWNLWVGGAPNAAKDGIAPLGGIVETDWSPYTFTMNWRFTRPDHPIRFERDEPFCFFFPVQRAVLSDVTPEIRPLADEPELLAAYREWSRSRDAFHEWANRTNPTAPADQWQKLYYRGLMPDGAPGPDDHQSKLRPKPFREARARKRQAVPPPACPVAPAIPGLTAPAPISDLALGYTLRAIGFDPDAPAPTAPAKPGKPKRR